MSAHAIIGAGIRGWRPEPPRDPAVDELLDAEALLAETLDRAGLLYVRHNRRDGLLLSVDADVRAMLVIVHAVNVDRNGRLVETVDTVRLVGVTAVLAAVMRVGALDAEAKRWATDVMAAIRGDA